MIWNNVELFNVEQIEKRNDGATVLYRFPKKVSDAIGGDKYLTNKYIARFTTGCEIRFVCDKCDVTLSAYDADGFVEVYRGDFFVSSYRIEKGVRTRIELQKGHNIDKCDMSGVETSFDSDVWRIVFAHDFCGVICDIEPYTNIRPPHNNEVPDTTILAYGSSITHGACSMVFSNAYISRASKIAKMQVLCKGMGGSCHCEKEVADYIAEAKWDIAVLELAVNMLDFYSEEEFEKRVEYLLKNVIATRKKVLLISHFRHSRDLSTTIPFVDKNKNFIAITKKLADKYKCDNLLYVDGRDIVDDYTMLSADLIHPSQYGHSVMGERIAEQLLILSKRK